MVTMWNLSLHPVITRGVEFLILWGTIVCGCWTLICAGNWRWMRVVLNKLFLHSGEMILIIRDQAKPCGTHSELNISKPAMNVLSFVMTEKRISGAFCPGCLLIRWKGRGCVRFSSYIIITRYSTALLKGLFQSLFNLDSGMQKETGFVSIYYYIFLTFYSFSMGNVKSN